MEDDCIIIEDSDEDTKEVFVISDSEETNEVSSWEHLHQENANLENPMYCEDDLTKREESEELEKDVLLQRLKKKLLQARSLKEQQSLENLIQKRREKISKEKNPPPPICPSIKARSSEQNGFHMPDPSPGVSFSIKNGASKAKIQDRAAQQQGGGGAFWSLQGERDVRDLFEGGKRFSDKDEKELKESLKNMQSELEEKSARRRRKEQGKGVNSTSQPSAVSNLSQFMQQQQQFQAEFKQHFGSQQQQIHRSPRLQPYDKKSLEETQREVGMSERLGPTNKGFNMLKAMGYKEGEGLGKEGEGRREPVTISKRQGKAGLGS